MDGRICSFCLTEVSSNHAVAIFSQKCLREGNISLLESVFAWKSKLMMGCLAMPAEAASQQLKVCIPRSANYKQLLEKAMIGSRHVKVYY